MFFDLLGIASLMFCSGSFAWAIAYDLGEARASRIWEERMRSVTEHVGEVQKTAMLFAAVDLPLDQHGYFDELMRARSQRGVK